METLLEEACKIARSPLAGRRANPRAKARTRTKAGRTSLERLAASYFCVQ